MMPTLDCTIDNTFMYRYPACGGGSSPVDVAVENLINVTSAADVTAARTALDSYLWGVAGRPVTGANALASSLVDARFADMPNRLRTDRYTFNLPWGYDSKAYLHVAQSGALGRLWIYHSGHAQGPDDYDTRLGIDEPLRRGFDVLQMSMPHAADNATGTYESAAVAGHHDMTRMEEDRVANGYSPMRLFVEPVVRALNALAGSYSDVTMVGLSGGGWTTVVCASLDTRIAQSYPVAGSLPWFARNRADGNEEGDFEQFCAGLLECANYEDMYVMATHPSPRRQIASHNVQDTCCFKPTRVAEYAAAIRARVSQVGGGSWSWLRDKWHTRHQVGPHVMASLLRDAGVTA